MLCSCALDYLISSPGFVGWFLIALAAKSKVCTCHVAVGFHTLHAKLMRTLDILHFFGALHQPSNVSQFNTFASVHTFKRIHGREIGSLQARTFEGAI